MRRSWLVGVMAASVVTITLVRPDEKPGPTEEDIVQKLPNQVQVLLAGGLCDNIHEVFLQEAMNLPKIPYANRGPAQERIEYYREWLRRKGCG